MDPVLTPTPGVNPRDALATSLFAAPGVYAVLVGSGVSTGAGVLTGQRILDDLIRRVARAGGTDLEQAGTDASAWWLQETGLRPRYDVLLERLAATDGARQSLLRGYFESNPDTGQPIRPTAAHHALAQLCRDEYVRVILTTNFDTLIEQALASIGVEAQVLATDSAIRARVPLVHAAPTLVKLHGDYRTLGLRNTAMELSTYSRAQLRLLREVFDDYGLLVVGWSAEWDTALAHALERTRSRRYPLYWASYNGDLTETARLLLTNRGACEIPSRGADDVLPDLVTRVERVAASSRRHRLVTIQRGYVFAPSDYIMRGWAAVPLLRLRTVAAIDGVPLSEAGLIGPEQRERILTALRASPLREWLAAWNGQPGADASPGNPKQPPTGNSAEPTAWEADWVPVLGVQTSQQAVYRTGSDASTGLCAIADVRLPSNEQGAAVICQLDIGISLRDPLDAWNVAIAMREGFVLVTSALPPGLSDILPADSHVTRCEGHLVASVTDEIGHSRDNDLDRRINFAAFHPRSDGGRPQVGRSLGFRAAIPGGLTSAEAAELVAAGFNQMLLDAGFLDPRPGLAQLQSLLGLPIPPRKSHQ